MRLLFLLLVSSSVFAQQTDTFSITKEQEIERKIESKDPFVTLGGKSGGDITATEAKNSCCLSVNINEFKATSFTLTINGQGDVLSYQGAGNMLTAEMKTALGKLRSGDVFSVERILIRGNDGIPRQVYPLFLK